MWDLTWSGNENNTLAMAMKKLGYLEKENEFCCESI